jgi:hypothetical protein
LKKIALLFLIAFFSVGMAACNQIPDEVIDCLENPDAPECQICEDGYVLEGTECVPQDEPVECEDGYQEINGQCVLLDNRTTEEILVDYIVDNFDQTGDLTFLSTTMEAMDFSEALTITTELNFNVTDDGEEHYITSTVTDAYLEDTVNGDMMKRHLVLDFDGEMDLSFELIYHEVATGVHVYVDMSSLFDALAEEDQELANVLNWIGLGEDWVVFRFDDSLEQVIQLEVLSDMMTTLLFSEIGEISFTDFQENELEADLGFDLNQYGFDLGAMVDLLIEEDYDSLELMIQAIDVEGIQLHLDHLNVAWRLEHIVRQVEADLVAEGFTVTKINLLHTATYDELTEVATLINDPIDRTLGTVAFFESLTEEELTTLVQTLLIHNLYEQLQMGIDPMEVPSMQQGLLDFLTSHETALNDEGVAATAMIAYIQTNGLQDFLDNYLTEAEFRDVVEALVFPEVEALMNAIDSEEALEYIMDRIWGDPHVTALLADINSDPYLVLPVDTMILATNLMAIDFDAFASEMVDPELLATAIYEGPVAYDTFLQGLDATAPNMVLVLELFSPSVEMLQPYMMYVDDAIYAMDNLSLFEDFIDPAYYMDDVFDVEVIKTEDVDVLMIMEIDGVSYAQIFNDLTDQLGIYLAGFDTIPYPFDDEWNCTVMDCTPPDFGSVLAELTQVGATEMHMLMDPSNPSWMEMGIDFTEFANYVVGQDSYNNSIVNDLSLTVTIEDTATIELPVATETAVVNDVVNDLAKFAITNEAYNMLGDYAEYYAQNPTELPALIGTEVALEDIDFLRLSQAFDLVNSNIAVSATDFTIELFWIDGAPVFDEPLSLSVLAALWLDGNLQSEAGYDFMVDAVDDTTFDVTRLFMYYMFQDEYDYYKDDYGMYN